MIGPNHLLASAVTVSAVAAYYDLRTGHIPNWVTFGPLAVAPIGHFVLGFVLTSSARSGAEAAGFSILGALACALVPIFLYRANAIGGGDVKLMAAVGAICRPMVGVEAEFYAFLAAAIFAPARLAWEGKLLRTLGNTLALVANPFLPKARRREIAPEAMTSLRFGPAIFAGALGVAILHWNLRQP